MYERVGICAVRRRGVVRDARVICCGFFTRRLHRPQAAIVGVGRRSAWVGGRVIQTGQSVACPRCAMPRQLALAVRCSARHETMPNGGGIVARRFQSTIVRLIIPPAAELSAVRGCEEKDGTGSSGWFYCCSLAVSGNARRGKGAVIQGATLTSFFSRRASRWIDWVWHEGNTYYTWYDLRHLDTYY